MPCGRLARLGVAIHPPPAAHDALDVLRSAGAPDAQQALFGLATRTFSRAAPGSRPTRQLNQWAQEVKPLLQPWRASNSRMRSRRRAVAASRCAESSAISSPRRSSSAVERAGVSMSTPRFRRQLLGGHATIGTQSTFSRRVRDPRLSSFLSDAETHRPRTVHLQRSRTRQAVKSGHFDTRGAATHSCRGTLFVV